MLTIKNRLKTILKEKDITQLQLAEMTGLTQTQINRVVADKSNSLNKKHLSKIAEVLQLTEIDELLEILPLENLEDRKEN